LTVKDWVTGAAATKSALPACDARNVHVPPLTIVTIPPVVVVHTLVSSDENDTGKPLGDADAIPLTENESSPYVFAPPV
jgi:hypothetical protein